MASSLTSAWSAVGAKVNSPKVKPAVCQSSYLVLPFHTSNVLGVVMFKQCLTATPATHHRVGGGLAPLSHWLKTAYKISGRFKALDQRLQ